MIETSRKKPSPQAEPDYRVPALEKGLDVIELLAGEAHGFTLKEIAARLDRTSQELFRTLTTLESRGYLLRDGAGRYRASTKLFELGNRHASTQALVARAMPHMERLAEEIGESCHLSIVVQDRMLVVARAECSADVKISVRIGATYEMHRRVSGEVAMAYHDGAARRRYWERHHVPAAERQILEARLDAIRQAGFEARESPIIIGAQDFAAPVCDGSGGLMAVLCMSRLSRVGEDPQREAFVEAVRNTAAAIGAEFGPAGVDAA